MELLAAIILLSYIRICYARDDYSPLRKPVLSRIRAGNSPQDSGEGHAALTLGRNGRKRCTDSKQGEVNGY